MQLILQKPLPNLIFEAEHHFSSNFLNTLSPSYLGLRKIKNLILKQQFKLNESKLKQANKDHQYKDQFFSASYSGDWLLLGICPHKIGVDIEILKPRNKLLLKKYASELEILWESSRNHFYTLWTAKEAILKASNSNNLDLIDQIKLLKKEKKTDYIDQLSFDLQLTFEFQQSHRNIQSGSNETLVRSICTT